MKTLQVKYHDWEPPTKGAQAPHSEGISENLLATENGKPTFLQTTDWGQNPDTIAHLRRLLRFGIKFDDTSRARLSGIVSSNQFFGTVPPQPTRRRYACREARLYDARPEFKQVINELSQQMWAAFQKHLPEQAAIQERIVAEAIHPDWRIGGTPFTSGIINNKSALPYHKDSGNLVGAWSMMLTIRAGVDGGGLHIPHYDTTLATPDQSLSVFNGQGWWHGVTPLVFKKKDAYRFTLVWYVKEQVRNCVSCLEEPARARLAATSVQDTYLTGANNV